MKFGRKFKRIDVVMPDDDALEIALRLRARVEVLLALQDSEHARTVARVEELEAQVATMRLGDADQVKERDAFIDRVVAEGRRMSEYDCDVEDGIAIDRFTDWIEKERPR